MGQAKYSSEWILAQTVLSKTRMAYISKHHPTQPPPMNELKSS